MLSDITRHDVERLQTTLRGKKTPRKAPRKGATVNRYVYLLSAIFSRAIRDEVVDFNPCRKFDREPESKRERYLTPSEQSKLMEVLVDDFAFLRAPIEVSLGTKVRKHTELLKLKIANVNFSGLSVFRPANGRDVEVRPIGFFWWTRRAASPPSFDSDEWSSKHSFAEGNRQSHYRQCL